MLLNIMMMTSNLSILITHTKWLHSDKKNTKIKNAIIYGRNKFDIPIRIHKEIIMRTSNTIKHN